MSRQTLTLFFLALLVWLSFFLVKSFNAANQVVAENKNIHEIAVAKGVVARYFDKDKQVAYTLSSERVIEYSHNVGTRFMQVKVDVLDDNNVLAWQGRANTAHLAKDKSQLWLTGHVVLDESPTSSSPTHIYSERMAYNASKRHVGSDQQVKVVRDGMTQSAQRFLLFVKEKQLAFDGNIKAHFEESPK